MSLPRLIAGICISLGVAGLARAADLPARKAGPAEAPPPAFTWSGFYLGVNGGYGGGAIDADLLLAQPPVSFGGAPLSPGFLSTQRSSNRTGGFVLGGQVGFNYQFPNNLVLGLESDAQWSNVAESEHESGLGFPLGAVRSVDLHIGLGWFGTTRLRTGYALGRFLPYLTGGVAYGRVSSSGAQNILGAGTSLTAGAASATQVGWAVGAGGEFAVANGLSLKAEYLYLQLPGVSGSVSGLIPPPLPAFGRSTTGAFGAHVARAGVNWRFGGGGAVPGMPAPLVATDLSASTPTRDWTGFYLGVNGGRGGGVVDADLALFQPPLAPSPGFGSLLHTSNRTGGFVAGGQVGYNYQLASGFVLGVESDAQWSDVRQSQHETTATATIFPFASARATDLVISLDWFGTSRLRLGYALDRFLPYFTGGVAYGGVSGGGFQNVLGAGPGVFASSASRTRAGWAAGAGAEYGVTDRLSLKAEYLYADFGGVGGPVAAFLPPPLPAFGSFTTGAFGMHVARAGLNWKLGGFGGGMP